MRSQNPSALSTPTSLKMKQASGGGAMATGLARVSRPLRHLRALSDPVYWGAGSLPT